MFAMYHMAGLPDFAFMRKVSIVSRGRKNVCPRLRRIHAAARSGTLPPHSPRPNSPRRRQRLGCPTSHSCARLAWSVAAPVFAACQSSGHHEYPLTLMV